MQWRWNSCWAQEDRNLDLWEMWAVPLGRCFGSLWHDSGTCLPQGTWKQLGPCLWSTPKPTGVFYLTVINFKVIFNALYIFFQLKDLLLLTLHFTTLLIEHSFSRHLYNSMEHLTSLLSSNCLNVVLEVLNLLYMFSKRSNFISRLASERRVSLLSRLTYLAEVCLN